MIFGPKTEYTSTKMDGKEQIKQMRYFCDALRTFLDEQPPAKELDATAGWLTELNSMYARLAEMEGMAEGFISQLTFHAISEMPDEEYKKIKSSSTLTTRYIQGKFPDQTRVINTVLNYRKVLQTAADNTRTLMSSYRQEMDMENRTTVRNTKERNPIPSR